MLAEPPTARQTTCEYCDTGDIPVLMTPPLYPEMFRGEKWLGHPKFDHWCGHIRKGSPIFDVSEMD